MKKCINVSYDNIGRIYEYDDGSKYYSVTTMLSATGDKEILERWRKRVGDEEATKISNTAAHLGEEYHLLGEHYLKGTEPPKVNVPSTEIFKTTKPFLDEHVTKVHDVEGTLLTDKYQLSGRGDGVVDWDHNLAILDYKLLKHFNRSWLKDYWIQTAIYAQAWKEMHGEYPARCVLVVGNKETIATKCFVSRPERWKHKVEQRVKQFQEFLKQNDNSLFR